MKKAYLITIPIVSIILTYLLGTIFIANLNDDILKNAWPFFLGFAVINFAHLCYFIYILNLHSKNQVTTLFTIISVPPVAIYIIFKIFFTILSIGRIRHLELGYDPFAPSTTITTSMYVPWWSTDAWITNKMFVEKYRDAKIHKMQITRQGSLIGHIGTDLQGWTEEEIKYAFGEPEKIMTMDTGLEKWIYHPWTNHPDWEMPVYLQDGKLLKIGD